MSYSVDMAGNDVSVRTITIGETSPSSLADASPSVTQLTNKSTGVTLNAPAGQIVMNNASLGATTSVAFTLTNNVIQIDDTVLVNIQGTATTNSYFVQVELVANGSCRISLRNYTAGALVEAVVLNFVVIKVGS